jgi:hypothetical protein
MDRGTEMKKFRYYIGIDTGVETGFAIWDRLEHKLAVVQTMKIHEAMLYIVNWCRDGITPELCIRVEDARKRTWFGKAGREQLQGAGSIKRDAKIWEDFLTDLGVEFEMVAPKNNKTKLNADIFKRMTGWQGKTNEHSRDAAMLVFGM